MQLNTTLKHGKYVRGRASRKLADNPKISYGKRQRAFGTQGRPHSAACVRTMLYEWYISMRFSIDWKRYNAICRSRGLIKCIGRFPRSLLKAKLQEILAEYCHSQLVNGFSPTPFQITPKWFAGWENEFGLALKHPNRKFKVPLAVMEERCEIGWTSVFKAVSYTHLTLPTILRV